MLWHHDMHENETLPNNPEHNKISESLEDGWGIPAPSMISSQLWDGHPGV